jgi:hypothetical protein
MEKEEMNKLATIALATLVGTGVSDLLIGVLSGAGLIELSFIGVLIMLPVIGVWSYYFAKQGEFTTKAWVSLPSIAILSSEAIYYDLATGVDGTNGALIVTALVHGFVCGLGAALVFYLRSHTNTSKTA